MLTDDFRIVGGNGDISIDKVVINNIAYVTLKVSFDELVVPERFSVIWKISGVGCASVWHPFERKHILRPDWGKNEMVSRLASGLPIYQIVSPDDKNIICFSVSDVDTPMKLKSGYIEETAEMELEIEFFNMPVGVMKEYSAVIRIDERDIPYYDAIYDTRYWWEEECGYAPAYVPKYAKLPMDSLWYSFHQNLDFNEIIEECKLSYQLGMKTVIIDDGWQTGDNNRGYAFCGDWEAYEPKMGDMTALVDEIHKIGMKVILWYSVPFMGIYAKNFDKFRDMLLDNSGNDKDFFALDPRYKEVRYYLACIYENAVRNWGLDGLKLDFIDSFVLKGKSLENDSRRDTESLEAAIHMLMSDVTRRLRVLNPDILIEFRQSYIGPSICKYGNMLRVGDCPADYLTNRSQIIDMRYTSGKTAIHSDMMMWNKDENVEIAALQIANSIFGVPQISVKINEMPEKHIEMIRFYLDFWLENRDVLLGGKLIGYNPSNGYSKAVCTLKNKSVVAVYTDNVVDIKTESCVIVNAGTKKSVIIKTIRDMKYKTVDCLGNIVDEGVINTSLSELSVPVSGIVYLN